MKKMKMKTNGTIAEHFETFLLNKQASGVTDKTLTTYRQHFGAISKFLDTQLEISDLTQSVLDKMIVDMRNSTLSHNSISSYSCTLKVFLNWCNAEGLTDIHMKQFKRQETLKETYTDKELKALLKKPNTKKCSFAEYRNWVIINFLLNSGCRAATLRNIRNEDVDLDNRIVYYRHTKNKKPQVIPLCGVMVSVLKEYQHIRGGSKGDFFFPNDTGGQLTENGLRCTIARYNQQRGVQKTSIHLFRHTFARKYLIDCGGDAFTLQKILGHSTLDMTKHYCAIFDADLTKHYDSLSPLAQLKGAENRIKMGA